MQWTGFLQEGLAGFPLPAEAWLDELLASIFRMLVNLESTDAKGKDNITFLMNDSSLYRYVFYILRRLWHVLQYSPDTGIKHSCPDILQLVLWQEFALHS